MSKNFKPLSLTLSLGALVGSLAVGSAANATQLFAVNSLGSAGYMAVGEGMCGTDKMDSNKDGMVSRAEHDAAAKAMFDSADANKDGMMSKEEMTKSHEGKCGEGKCGADMKGHEGKCGSDKGKEASCGADKGKEASCGADKGKEASCGADKGKEGKCGGAS